MNVLAKNELDAICELKNSIDKHYRFFWMKLFGSKARGDANKESDVVVCIVLEETNWKIEREIYELCFEIGLKYDILLSPVVFSKDEISNRLTMVTPFYRVMEREGIAI